MQVHWDPSFLLDYILSANYRPFFLAPLSYPLLGKVLSSYGGEPRRNVLFAQNWGQIYRRSVEVRTFVRIQKVIWDHLLASKKEAPFSFGIMCILCTPRPTYRPTVDRCIGRHIGRHIGRVSTDMLIDISVYFTATCVLVTVDII